MAVRYSVKAVEHLVEILSPYGLGSISIILVLLATSTPLRDTDGLTHNGGLNKMR